jgi:hypothetical protein
MNLDCSFLRISLPYNLTYLFVCYQGKHDFRHIFRSNPFVNLFIYGFQLFWMVGPEGSFDDAWSHRNDPYSNVSFQLGKTTYKTIDGMF